MLLPILLLSLAPPAQQAPPQELRNTLNDRSPAVRHALAEEIAALGPEYDRWVVKESKKGSPNRRRALILTAALMGTERCFDLIEDLSSSGRRADGFRAWALFLYGAFHPSAGVDPKKDWKRGATPFERSCFMAGLLSRASRVPETEWRQVAGKKAQPQELALITMFELLRGQKAPISPDKASTAARVLASTLIEVASVDFSDKDMFSGFPDLWLHAAQHASPRSFSDLQDVPLAGDFAGLVFALQELPRNKRQEAFLYLNEKVSDPQALCWLWGVAGDLRLALPKPVGDDLATHEVAGILRLALQDPQRAVLAAQRRRASATALFHSKRRFEERWPAALILAFCAEDDSKSHLKSALESAPPLEQDRLHPLWLFANRPNMASEFPHKWLIRWSLEIGASSSGFLNQQGRYWLGRVLLGGTQASQDRLPLSRDMGGLAPDKHDHSLEDELYADIAEFILSDLHFWDLP